MFANGGNKVPLQQDFHGLRKSTDAGETWTHLGLKETQAVARIRIHPTNPDLVYVAALGHIFDYVRDTLVLPEVTNQASGDVVDPNTRRTPPLRDLEGDRTRSKHRVRPCAKPRAATDVGDSIS